MTDYVDAGEAIPHVQLSNVRGEAPATSAVDYDRIRGARSEPQNWLTYYGTYDGQRYSELDQINKDSIRRLSPAWVFQAGAVGMQSGASTYSFEASPIVVEGVMYVSGPDGRAWAIDARTGEELWRYKHASPYDVSLCCGNVNRGLAVGHGKVYMYTLNAHIIALDATTGKVVWDTVNGDVRAGESGSVAPLIVKDLVIVGSAGGEFGVRGHLDAFDAETGERRWRCYTVPKPGEPGSETWPDDGEAWQRGGANCWVTPTYDPELELLFQGTGNPAPDFDGGVRPGDNLYTDSTIAVDVNTGEIRWHYQFTPHDLWDYDSTMENVLFDAPDGRKLLAHADKNGYFFVLDRTNGELVRVFPFVDRITWGEITPEGKVTPKIYPDEEGVPVHFWPGPAGGKEWTHMSYNPQTGLMYVPVQEVGATATRRRREFKESIPYWGAGVAVDIEDFYGFVAAIDPLTGEEKWRWNNEYPMCASTLTTAGGLVFQGTPTGEFVALDASTGEKLWSFQCGSGHHSSPTTFEVDGRQFIAVPTGWGGWVEGFLPGLLGAAAGDALFCFALPEQ
ncbi:MULTISPECIES: PQQ-dependent dehydrogenase, methanol/ethanol family [Pseudonocardia]|uniref:PQQ-dependent dehydrogenase, methanol/ethanol family n=1 Tax=Pseudonocardia alni subsp. carboxydivorans TaxID=415010 RepID=A0ABU9AC76_PSEA5|nr:PQQ-dependent dehydrogenase, methanol/ethanol family [Pseudonocardia sp. DR1-2]MCM3848933.1 PQQ-dependent dehydrogenase, methanol/ethanol family [Pseudonocardia sp. DR1-2]WFG46287.1 PQQ-dependent dehydrogenase, methanol/ethanol family [Pseudonocardia alni]